MENEEIIIELLTEIRDDQREEMDRNAKIVEQYLNLHQVAARRQVVALSAIGVAIVGVIAAIAGCCGCFPSNESSPCICASQFEICSG
jgi:hypothetical protein